MNEKDSEIGSTSPIRYERDFDESPSESVVIAVSNVTGKSITPEIGSDEDEVAALSPLYEAIDPDALNTLLTPEPGEQTNCLMPFQYEGCSITIDDDAVTVTPSE
ncbi:HalOD1 output domain-containing protein [Natrarchaeobius chitinivorans]|nr:HalOD1 output domain-containing protein [Natrarchaeobius chitinivorans]